VRTWANLTQENLGVLGSIDKPNASAKMNQYERGTHIPRYPQLNELTAALGLPTAYVYA